ncbi:Crp/Fnr family transcriptional regulator [Bradyrhizobium sp. CB2312]|uniref:Crp/Fnr family transcriptional regulator n=1 Tax=Bradyrhizobium sp. CB2312 TaxID=3039155 RepID=UPI0024B26BDA|nr:Crp/Fnr family transcriptional regulator [Bradyrhizobium sp. CB2312]WFU75254.1 Crp/Fnr family transcriptional regulator [Bradyrhizobium sp. CB2312]
MSLERLIGRLEAVSGLSPVERDQLLGLPVKLKQFADGDYILREGDTATNCGAVVSGYVSRQKIVGSRSQILALYVPGDIPDLHTLHLPRMDHDLCSVGPSTVAFIPHSDLQNLLTSSAALTHVFWRETLTDGAVFREWVAALGARSALPRIGHLLCELAARLEVVGLMRNNSFEFPFTQQNVADACGLSVVHVNRMIQELRSRGLIEWEKGEVMLLNRGELEVLAEFNADYLHIDDGKRRI